MGSKVDGAYESLIQGISQQAPIDRVSGQSELLENFSCDPEKGLVRRPPTEFISYLMQAGDTNTAWYNVILNDEEVLIAITGTTVKAATIAELYAGGTMQAVTMRDSSGAYVAVPGRIEVLSVNDKVYITNASVKTAMLSDKRQYVTKAGLVFLLGGQYGRKYVVTVKGTFGTVSVEHSTPDGSNSSHINDISTTEIASQLTTKMNAAGTDAVFSTYFTAIRESDVIYLKPKGDYGTLSITVEDGDGGANIFAVADTAGDIGKLPRYAPNGYLVKIIGAAGEAADDWFLEFVTNDGSTGDSSFGKTGYWLETVSPDVPYKYDLTKMPHALVKEDSSYILKQVEWEERKAGDDETNPQPSFVGNTINDIAMFQGRLVFLSGSNVVMSRTNKYEDFWVNSATTLVDSDPIDISSASARSTPVFEYAIPHSRDLVIFSSSAQFIVFGRNAITPTNTSLVLTTTYETETSASPVASGKNVFYPINYGKFTGVKEFYTEGDVDINASRPITSHCTQYLDGKVSSMATSTTFDLLLVQTVASKRKLYAYEYIWINDEKAQSAWSSWIMPWDVEHVFFMENNVMLVYKQDGKYSLGQMSLARVEDAGGYQVHLDSKEYIKNVFTAFTAPYATQDIKVVQDEGCPNPGLEAKVLSNKDGTITLAADMNGGTVIVGIPYASRFVPTRPVVRDRNNIPVGTGRLQVFTFRMTCTDTGSFDAVVVSKWYPEAVTHFSGRFLNSLANRVGEPAVESGKYNLPFMNDVEYADLEIRSNYITPLRINRLEWVGNYIKKGTRL